MIHQESEILNETCLHFFTRAQEMPSGNDPFHLLPLPSEISVLPFESTISIINGPHLQLYKDALLDLN